MFKKNLFVLLVALSALVITGCLILVVSTDSITITHTAASVDFNMHFVPSGGTFTMGEHVETTTQVVTLKKDFWMGETEVTQELWEAVWGTTWPSNDIPTVGFGLGDDYPAYFVNWYDAVAFCNLLTEADESIASDQQVYYADPALTILYTKTHARDENPIYTNKENTGYRLPTEEEWEYAARYIDGTTWNPGDHVSGDKEYAAYDSGATLTSGSPIATDARLGTYAWWSGNAGDLEKTTAYGSQKVGLKTANALGLYDMSGNVWEWCSSQHDDDDKQVRRGGSWNSTKDSLGSSKRSTFDLSAYRNTIGFRLARNAE